MSPMSNSRSPSKTVDSIGASSVEKQLAEVYDLAAELHAITARIQSKVDSIMQTLEQTPLPLPEGDPRDD